MIEYWNPQVERMPVDELKELQEQKLKELVHYVYRHSPFYKKKFDDAGVKPEDVKTLDDVKKLPFTYKQDLRDTYPTGMFCVPNEQLVRFHVSSGTTGKPTVVGYTKNDIDQWSLSLAKKVASSLKSVLNLAVEVELVENGSLPRSMGKPKKVIDKRKI